jgi:hypothetical protein
MRTMNCQNVRSVIEAADRGDLLSVAAMEHINACQACEKFNDEHVKLREIVSDLGIVKAPEDFEFRLRARIARANVQRAQSTLNRLNLGFGSLAFASLMVIFGGAMLLVNLRSPEQAPVVVNPTPAALPIAAATPFQQPTGSPGLAVLSPTSTSTVDRVSARRAPARTKQTGRTGTREMASAPARVVRPGEMTARASDFPIDTSAQPVRVSMDDGRGSSKTISVPRVSFGSQRVLSQSNSPLVASARGAW